MGSRDGYLSRRSLIELTGAGLMTAVAGCSGNRSPKAAVREELDPYRDIGIALDTGYRSQFDYIETDDGGLGIPFVNEESAGGPPIPERPAVLFYDLTEDAQYELVGAEWTAPAESVDDPPTLFEQSFDGPIEGRWEGQSTHYGLTAWPYRDNPAGLFAPANPEVSAPSFMADVRRARRALEPYRDIEAARADGYEHWYVTHYFNMERADSVTGPESLDPADPMILVYCEHTDGAFDLIGAVWFVAAGTTDGKPSMFGQPMNGPMPSHDPPQPRHYGLHGWLFSTNPKGMFHSPADRGSRPCGNPF